MTTTTTAPATQADIAKAVGLDVSTVNKILNRTPGPKFKGETIKLVLRAARRFGYPVEGRRNKYFYARYAKDLEKALREVWRAFNTGQAITHERREEIHRLVAQIGGAAIILLILRAVIGM